MKSKKEIAALTAAATGIEFPRFDSAREQFTVGLREAVFANFGYTAREAFEYDEHDGTFHFELYERAGCEESGVTARIERTFAIDPRKDLLAEFARVEAEIERFKLDAYDVRALVENHRAIAAKRGG